MPNNGRSLRVLVVDDNVDAAESMALILEAGHHDVRTAHDGLRAIEVADEYRPDVIVLDIGMPVMNGYQVAQYIGRAPWGHDVVLIACTGWGQPEDRRRSYEAGIDHHLVKPVSASSMLQLLSNIEGGRPG